MAESYIVSLRVISPLSMAGLDLLDSRVPGSEKDSRLSYGGALQLA